MNSPDDSKLAWYAVRAAGLVILGTLAFGGHVTLAFLAGWWWGLRETR
jgi:hypothetical protein